MQAAAAWPVRLDSREDKYEVSLKCGERALFPAVRKAGLSTLVMADGFSCREQIQQDTPRHALHLAEVMQMALREGNASRQMYPEENWSEKELRGGVVPCNARPLPRLRSSLAALSYGEVFVA